MGFCKNITHSLTGIGVHNLLFILTAFFTIHCSANFCVIFEEVNNRIYKGESVDAVYLDFQKPFDKVLHMRLLNEIRAHGINGKKQA